MLEGQNRTREKRAPDAPAVWRLLLSLKASLRKAQILRPVSFSFRAGQWHEGALDAATVTFDATLARGYRSNVALDNEARDLLDMFAPICVGERAQELVVGHIAQSLDGRIATPTGASQFITGPEDITHTHRLRALCDAVLVGARTVEFDNPRLTTRLVEGEHATRVILDPTRRLDESFSVFRDTEAPTLVLADETRVKPGEKLGRAEILGVPMAGTGFDVEALLKTLRACGLHRLFVEGGGITVSRFLSVGVFDRLHVTVAPMIIGSGTSSIALAPINQLAEAMRFGARHFSLGRDVLFDCDLRA